MTALCGEEFIGILMGRISGNDLMIPTAAKRIYHDVPFLTLWSAAAGGMMGWSVSGFQNAG